MNISKSSTTYSTTLGSRGAERFISLTVNYEAGMPHISVHEGESCSGVLKHWGSPENLIAELECIIKFIKKVEVK